MDLDHVINFLIPLLEKFQLLGYWIILLISCLESVVVIGLFVPGTIFSIAIGFIASQGYLDIGDAIVFAAIGAIIGDISSFYLGKTRGRSFLKTSKVLKEAHLDMGEEFFNKHGNKSVFLGRFVGPLRPIVPFIAGMCKMRTRTFAILSIIGGFAWSTTYLLLGYFFGHAWKLIETWSTRIGIFTLLVVIVLVGLYYLKKFILKKGEEYWKLTKSIFTSFKKSFYENPDVLKIGAKYPRIIKFLKSRTRRDKFYGRTLTLLSIILIYFLFMFFGVLESVLKSESILDIDIRVQNLLYIFRDTELIKIFSWITFFGDWQVVCVWTAVFLSIFLLYRKKTYILSFIITIAGSQLLNVFGKMIIQRSRPENGVYIEPSYAFPSAHSNISVALYGFFIYFLWNHFKKFGSKLDALFIGIVFISAIGFSRLYLGVHFLSDVWGGYLLGLIWLIIGITVNEWLISREERPQNLMSPSRRKRTISILMIVLGVSFYVFFGMERGLPNILEKTQIEEQTTANFMDIFTKENLPRHSEGLKGDNREPISFIIIVENETQLFDVFKMEGWNTADSLTFDSGYKMAKAYLNGGNYLTLPVTPYFWNKEVHNFAFQKPTETNNIRERHHIRFWNTHYKTTEGKYVYVGTASLDSGIKWGVFTHKMAPDIDVEREIIFKDLEKTGQIKTSQKIQFTESILGKNFTGDPFFTDGMAYVLELK